MKKASSDLLLPDVNVLIALAWPNHQFHAAALHALELSATRWATCALTQLGFIRISSQPAAIPTATTPGHAAALLASMVSDPMHVYIGSLPSPVEKGALKMFEEILGSKQVMDAYLVMLAERHHATLMTFDGRLKALAGPQTRVRVLGS